jgi:hypothetical protein
MTYVKAKECFEENKRLISPRKDPVAYNLSVGLDNLTNAMEADMATIKTLLMQIAQSLNR